MLNKLILENALKAVCSYIHIVLFHSFQSFFKSTVSQAKNIIVLLKSSSFCGYTKTVGINQPQFQYGMAPNV